MKVFSLCIYIVMRSVRPMNDVTYVALQECNTKKSC